MQGRKSSSTASGSGSSSGGALSARSTKVSATLSSYADGLSKKAEAITGKKQPALAKGPLLTPLATFTAPTAKPSPRAHPLKTTEEKSPPDLPTRSLARAVSNASTNKDSPLIPSRPLSSKRASGYAGPGKGPEPSESVTAANDHLSSPRIRKAGHGASHHEFVSPTPALAPYSVQRSMQAATESVVAKHGAPAVPAVVDPNVAFASQTKDQQRTSMRPWFLNIQESLTASTGRNHRRTRALQEKMMRTRGWGRQVREIVDINEAAFHKKGAQELDELTHLHTDLVKQQEINELRLEGIAAVFDLSTRATLKKQRQMQFVSTDHSTLKRIDAEKQSIFEQMWSRSHARRLRVKDEFCTSWEVLNFFGTRLHDQAQKMIAASTKHSASHLARLRQQIPTSVARQHAMQISLQDIGAATNQTPTAAAHTQERIKPAVFANTPGIGLATTDRTIAPTSQFLLAAHSSEEPAASLPPSDYRFAVGTASDTENTISLRLPTSLLASAATGCGSGIDPSTGKYSPTFVREHAGDASQQELAGKADRNWTSNREHLGLIHSNMTLIHTATPVLNPSWVTLCCESGPRLLPRPLDQLTSSPGYTLLYEELLREVEQLRHREHVLDMVEQAFQNYKQVVQLNTDQSLFSIQHATAALNVFYGGTLNSPTMANKKAARAKGGSESMDGAEDASLASGDLDGPLAGEKQLELRVESLVLELEVAGFGTDLLPFRSPAPALAGVGALGPIDDTALPTLKQLARTLLASFSNRSRYYSRFYMEVHSPSLKNSWFAGFILAPPPRPTAPGGSDSSIAPRDFSVLDVDFYSTTQTTLALHSDGSTFVCGHSRRVLSPLTDATVIGFVLDLTHGCIHFTVDGQEPMAIFGLGASMYTFPEQRQQAAWIMSQRLRPCFGLLGPKIKLQNAHRLHSKDSERERARIALGLDTAGNPIPGVNYAALLDKAKQPQRARHALTAHSSIVADATAEAAGTMFARETIHSPAHSPGNDVGLRSGLLEATSAPLSSHALHQQHNDGLLGWVVPKLSVNLGEFEFLYLPTGANLNPPPPTTSGGDSSPRAADARSKVASYNSGIGACLPMNTQEAPSHEAGTENDTSLLQAFTAHQAQKQLKAAQQAAAQSKPMSPPTTLKDQQSLSRSGAPSLPTGGASAGAGAVQSIEDAISDYKHRQGNAALQALDALRQEFLARPSEFDLRKQIDEQKVAFFQSVGPSRLVSWSHFPPQSVRVQQAVLKVQRIARRYIGFKGRRALFNKLSVYAMKIQRCWRRFRSRQTKIFVRAILPIQRVWRGYRARRMVHLLHKYHLTYQQAHLAAIRIQSFIRMVLARKKVLVLATVVQQKIEQIKGLVIFVQRVFRRRLTKRTVLMNKAMLSSVLIFQSHIRGIRLRRMLAAIDPTAARQLKAIASKVSDKQRRWTAVGTIQRWYRGCAARKFVRVKRNVMERDAHRLRDCWRAFQLRQRIDRAFRGYEAEYLKAFMQAIGYMGQQQTPVQSQMQLTRHR